MSEDKRVVRLDGEGAIRQVVLCNGDKLNAMGPTFEVELKECFDTLNSDQDCRVVILRAEGRAFCAGLDLMTYSMSHPEMMKIPPPAETKPVLLEVIRAFQEAITSVERCRKPVIAAIHGWCIGGGLDLAAACDIRLASSDVVFSLREARVAIMADLGSLQRLPRIIGEGHTRQLAYTAEDIDGDRAEKIGLVNYLYDTHENLQKAAEDMAAAIAANAPLAVQASKEVLNWGRGHSIDESLEYVAARNLSVLPSEDLMEAVASFMEKREPNFKGK